MVHKSSVKLVNITLLNFLARIIFFVFLFVVSYTASRYLSTYDFGQLQFILITINFGWLFLSFGIPTVISRLVSAAFTSSNKHAMMQLFVAIPVSSFAITLPAIVGLWFGIRFMELEISFSYCVALLVTQFVVNYLQIINYAIYQYKLAISSNLLASIIGFLYLLLFIQTKGLYACIEMYILANTITIIVLIIGLTNVFKNIPETNTQTERIDWKSFGYNAVFFGVSAILASIIWQRSEFFVLKSYFSFEELAVYGVAFTMLSFLVEPFKMIPSVLLNYFAGIKNELHGSKQFSMFLQHFSWLVIFMGIFMSNHSHELVTYIYTTKYSESAQYFSILLIGMVPGVCSYAIMNTHVGLGKSRFLFLQDTVTAFIFIILMYFFLQTHSIQGVAWAKSIAILSSVSMGIWYTHFRLKFKIPFQQLIFSVLLASALIVSSNQILVGSILLLGIKAIVLFAIYVFISFRFHIIDRSLINRIKHDVWSHKRIRR